VSPGACLDRGHPRADRVRRTAGYRRSVSRPRTAIRAELPASKVPEQFRSARCQPVSKTAARRSALRCWSPLRSPLFLRVRPVGGSGAVREGDHVSGLKYRKAPILANRLLLVGPCVPCLEFPGVHTRRFAGTTGGLAAGGLWPRGGQDPGQPGVPRVSPRKPAFPPWTLYAGDPRHFAG